MLVTIIIVIVCSVVIFFFSRWSKMKGKENTEKKKKNRKKEEIFGRKNVYRICDFVLRNVFSRLHVVWILFRFGALLPALAMKLKACTTDIMLNTLSLTALECCVLIHISSCRYFLCMFFIFCFSSVHSFQFFSLYKMLFLSAFFFSLFSVLFFFYGRTVIPLLNIQQLCCASVASTTNALTVS